MEVNNRVRGIILSSSNTVLLIKRLRQGVAPYWVAPGGGIEPSDSGPEAALKRELLEEVGATVDILRFAFTLETEPFADTIVRQHFYLCHLIDYDLARRSGPEFSIPGRGEYIPEELPLVCQVLMQMNIKPSMLKAYLEELSR
jgi:8-oxo-dGTP pyrophosphatase MutT (NUDIX family)